MTDYLAITAEQRRLRAMTLTDVLIDLPAPFRGAVAEIITQACRAKISKDPSPSIGDFLPPLPEQVEIRQRLDEDSRACLGR
ncbi:hypothetical protein [uncultured Thiodictyon sp.]|uniref:hypothetical protein n=1 Tax=uncultured Thiodictyon sp. TaxID=1846217 RepID=UPI0025FABC26|nr:hypothetical protein [uncultured Thiodictyon sp.]